MMGLSAAGATYPVVMRGLAASAKASARQQRIAAAKPWRNRGPAHPSSSEKALLQAMDRQVKPGDDSLYVR